MELPTVTVSSTDLMDSITILINKYIYSELNETDLAYQQKSNYLMGQINIITMLMNERWDFKSGQSYHEFLKYLVEKYSLNVMEINDLFEYKK